MKVKLREQDTGMVVLAAPEAIQQALLTQPTIRLVRVLESVLRVMYDTSDPEWGSDTHDRIASALSEITTASEAKVPDTDLPCEIRRCVDGEGV